MDKSFGKRIWRGTLIITLVGILAKLSAFLTDAILAYYLGTKYEGDAFYMVSNIKDVLYPMLSIGIWKVFLPLYKERITQGETREAEELTNKTITLFTAISVLVIVLTALFSEVLVSLVAPGFQGETRALCVRLVRLSAPMYIFIVASAVYASVLQSHEKFLGSQIREVASHIPMILATVLLYRRFKVDVLAYALIAGALVRLLVELPFVDWGYRFRPDFRFKTREFAVMLRRMPSALLSAGVAQLNTLVDKMMASSLKEGTISGLNYGAKLVNVLSGLISTSIATALYPQTIELITLNKREELSKLTGRIINIFSLLMLPISLACVLFRTEVVRAVFERGAFDEGSVAITAGVFALYSLGIFFTACSAVLSNLFYGAGDTKTPLYISLVHLVVNVALNLVFIRLWDVNGLALATSCSAAISFVIRLLAARKHVDLDGRNLAGTALKVLLCSLIACGLPRALFLVLSVNVYVMLAISALIGAMVYLGLIKLLRIPELDDLLQLLKRKKKSA